MVKLIVKNLKEVEETQRSEVEKICNERVEYYQDFFKKYDKDLILEVIFNKSAATYTVSASIDLKSKKVLLAEEDKDVVAAATRLFSEFKKAVKRQYELEKKEYVYKRKR